MKEDENEDKLSTYDLDQKSVHCISLNSFDIYLIDKGMLNIWICIDEQNKHVTRSDWYAGFKLWKHKSRIFISLKNYIY